MTTSGIRDAVGRAPTAAAGVPHLASACVEEELINSISHAAGLVLSLAGLQNLASITSAGGPARHGLACAVYGGSLVFLYAASTLYHGARSGVAKRIFLLLDYAGIYLLIAGTYTPLMLIAMPGPVGRAILAAVWGIAAVGVASKIRRFDRFEGDGPWLYLVMAGTWLIAFPQVLAAIPSGALAWVVAGLACYLVGLPFWARSHRRFRHAVWHAFVLAGSICHYRAVLGCLVADVA